MLHASRLSATPARSLSMVRICVIDRLPENLEVPTQRFALVLDLLFVSLLSHCTTNLALSREG